MAAEKKRAGKVREGNAKAKRNAQGGLANPVKPDADLATIVGSEPLTRAALTQKIWEYVKKNDLQDPKDRRTIRADANLKRIFGGKDSVSMFEMTRLVNQHVTSV